MIDFIHEFADTFHHAKKKTYSSGIWRRRCFNALQPVPQMLFEHEQARGYVVNMESATKKTKTFMIWQIMHRLCRPAQDATFTRKTLFCIQWL